MSLMRPYHIGLAIFALLLMSMQSVSISHAAQYGDEPHEHQGIICNVDAVISDTQSILPQTPVVRNLVSSCDPVYETAYLPAPAITPPGRAPPPRSPPTPSL